MTPSWWWLSYADAAGFRGGLVMPSPDPGHMGWLQAARDARMRNLSPGGQVVGVPIKPSALERIAPNYRERLLNRAEADAIVAILDEEGPP